MGALGNVKMGIYGISMKWFVMTVFIAGVFAGCLISDSFPSEAKTFVRATKQAIVFVLDEARQWMSNPQVDGVTSHSEDDTKS